MNFDMTTLFVGFLFSGIGFVACAMDGIGRAFAIW